MTSARPVLTSALDVQSFSAAYWLKAELQAFCRDEGLSAAGGKQEIAARIAAFLRDGVRLQPEREGASVSEEARRFNGTPCSAFTMESVVPRGFKCTQEMRRFFEAALGNSFRFTVTLQAFMRENPGIAFGEVAAEWKRQQERRRAGWRPEIGGQFEFNQFTRDFYADPKNVGRGRQECLVAWQDARAMGGHRS